VAHGMDSALRGPGSKCESSHLITGVIISDTRVLSMQDDEVRHDFKLERLVEYAQTKGYYGPRAAYAFTINYILGIDTNVQLQVGFSGFEEELSLDIITPFPVTQEWVASPSRGPSRPAATCSGAWSYASQQS
jgi:hypothetical protein